MTRVNKQICIKDIWSSEDYQLIGFNQYQKSSGIIFAPYIPIQRKTFYSWMLEKVNDWLEHNGYDPIDKEFDSFFQLIKSCSSPEEAKMRITIANFDFDVDWKAESQMSEIIDWIFNSLDEFKKFKR